MYFVTARRKVRGQKRRLKKLLNHIDDMVAFRIENLDRSVEDFSVPSGLWIEMPKTSGRAKTLFCKRWIAKAEEFISKKPQDVPFCKVVACIDMPNLWQSKIIIFYSKEYYDHFGKEKGHTKYGHILKMDVH